MPDLRNKVLFITGASRGIGLALALRAARDGAKVVIAAKTDTPHPKLSGTIHSAAEAVREAGGQALPVVVDVRHEESVAQAMRLAAEAFGGIDIVVNNASGDRRCQGTPSRWTMKRYDLMQSHQRAGHVPAQQALPMPHLRKARQESRTC